MKPISRRVALAGLVGSAIGVLSPAAPATGRAPGFFSSPEYAALAPDASDQQIRAAMEIYLGKRGVELPPEREIVTDDLTPDEAYLLARWRRMPPHQRSLAMQKVDALYAEEAAQPIDTTDNPFTALEFNPDATAVQCELLDWLNEGKEPTFYYDTEKGKASREEDYTAELEAEDRQQWHQAHAAQAQRLREYLDRFS